MRICISESRWRVICTSTHRHPHRRSKSVCGWWIGQTSCPIKLKRVISLCTHLHSKWCSTQRCWTRTESSSEKNQRQRQNMNECRLFGCLVTWMMCAVCRRRTRIEINIMNGLSGERAIQCEPARARSDTKEESMCVNKKRKNADKWKFSTKKFKTNTIYGRPNRMEWWAHCDAHRIQHETERNDNYIWPIDSDYGGSDSSLLFLWLVSPTH